MTDLLEKYRALSERHERMLSMGVNAVGLTNDRILSPTRPRRRASAPGAVPGREAAKLGKLTQHSRPTQIVTPSTLPPECFHTTKT